MAIEWTPLVMLLNTDFTLRVVCPAALTGYTLALVIRKEPEDAATVYSVTSGITLATVLIADDAADIPVTASGTNAMEEGQYAGAIWRTDAGQKRPLAYGPIIAKRAAAPP